MSQHISQVKNDGWAVEVRHTEVVWRHIWDLCSAVASSTVLHYAFHLAKCGN